jgi:hypothetical protein
MLCIELAMDFTWADLKLTAHAPWLCYSGARVSAGLTLGGRTPAVKEKSGARADHYAPQKLATRRQSY